MNSVAHLIQCVIVGATLVGVVWVFVMLVRADLRANPARAKLPAPRAGLQAIRAYIAAFDIDDQADDDDEPVETDRTPDPDHLRDLQIARDLGVA
ncbi:hypothetical protein [Nocardia sp. NPDC058480]|uniref:hypothetical protein n=1 Tax=Nocardia sp. NPDC058480 TaxID=3346522 RepID=UPI00365128A2